MIPVCGLVGPVATLQAQPWAARHGLTPAQYQAAFDEFTKKGYRLRSVSGYVSGGTERYAAFFENVTGPAYVARHGLSAAQYQSAFDTYTKQGYRLTWVSAHEFGSNERYTAIWEKKPGAAWVARHGLTSAQYQQAFNNYTKQGYRLIHVNGYTRNGSARFAAIFDKSAGPAWIARHNLTAAEYQKTFNDLSQKGYRVRSVSGYRPGSADLYAAIWEQAGGPIWGARHGVPDSWYQNVFDNFYYQGYRPSYISAFTSGSRARMNCIWENTSFTASNLQTITSKVKTYLDTYQVPGAAIAITKDGRLVYASGFGQANQSTGEEASATSLFRIASVSKPITSVAIMKLVEANKLSLDDKVFGPGSILGSKYSTPSGNKKIEKITVRHLLQHSSGLHNTPNDPMFQNTSYSHDQLINWVLNASDRKVTREPGSQYEYLNFGYCLLGRIIEVKSGMTYQQYVKTSVLNPSGATQIFIGKNDASQRRAREVVYYPAGAYSLNVERFDSHGGWIASPIDLVRFLVRVDGETTKADILSSGSRTTMVTKAGILDGNGNDPNYGFGWANNPQSHNGAMTGTIAILAKAQNGFTYAVVANTRPANDGFAGNISVMAQSIINTVSAWPRHDLF
jgi:CubicO group peptidase (beta-lactamase class C family)